MGGQLPGPGLQLVVTVVLQAAGLAAQDVLLEGALLALGKAPVEGLLHVFLGVLAVHGHKTFGGWKKLPIRQINLQGIWTWT